MWLLLGASAWAEEVAEPPAEEPAECVLTVAADTLAATTAEAAGAFASLDIEGFEAKAATLWRQLPCLSEPLTPLDVADVYKVRALDTFLDQDDDAVRDSLMAARAAAPDYRMPAALAPKGHPLKAVFDEVAVDTSPRVDLPVPRDARLLVDGQPVLTRPTDRAVLMQLVGADGAVVWTRLVESAEPAPAYETVSDDYRADYLTDAKVIRVRARRPIELVVASSAAIVGSGAMYALSRGSRAQFFDPSTPYDDLASLRARTNGLQTAAVVTAAAGIGLGATAVVTW